jgi:hypothetical protein
MFLQEGFKEISKCQTKALLRMEEPYYRKDKSGLLSYDLALLDKNGTKTPHP